MSTKFTPEDLQELRAAWEKARGERASWDRLQLADRFFLDLLELAARVPLDKTARQIHEEEQAEAARAQVLEEFWEKQELIHREYAEGCRRRERIYKWTMRAVTVAAFTAALGPLVFVLIRWWRQ